jgi:hypothetical protein
MAKIAGSVGLAMAFAWIAVLFVARNDSGRVQREDEAQVLASFHSRVQQYAELHRSLEGPVPTLSRSDDYAETKAAIAALGATLRTARKSARQGDIFTPDIESWFRSKIAECLEGCNTDDLLATLNEENPPGLVLTPQVNAQWPDEASLGPMPPALLAALPRLPEELQYRFMNRDLVLWDVHANLVVDFITKAMP